MRGRQERPADSPGDQAMALVNAAHLNWLEGGAENARRGLDLIEQAAALAQDKGWPSGQANALSLAARLHLDLNETEPAVARAARAVATYATLHFVDEASHWVYARALRAAERTLEADEQLRLARDRVQQVAGNTRDEALRRGWLENIRVNREILADWEKYGSPPVTRAGPK